MKIKDLPVGTKYKLAQAPRMDTTSTFIVVDIKYMQDTFGILEDEVGMSYCIDKNEIVPWRGHELCECIIVE
ncbi:hypothetical protein JR325_gp271 [Escherichia phage tuntematon]|uniref:Uncharacterized protein n=2 Tax=Phapecoctavirus TaxID=2733124 RepID=A0A6B9WZK4_9CAUD|nr:hypothetical protein JR324_gp008 [Escherichia phage nieznany]YP_009986554.1 hypothetical protein JR325_gp271 [Escherichia phage tuntematon]QHR69341.1 hypothetical protein nieznany_8 [Escherichia phage nieznany]QHR72034.1 hypothetical protein tuntematon_178 [Escherichia phage tuntematon]